MRHGSRTPGCPANSENSSLVYFLVYFEKGCPRSQVRGARLNSSYRAEWFDPRAGTWVAAGSIRSSVIGILVLPEFPGENDWGLRLVYEGQTP